MVLGGQFSYDSSNQRALPFNVLIEEISGPLRTYYGSNSKTNAVFTIASKCRPPCRHVCTDVYVLVALVPRQAAVRDCM